MAKHSSRAVGMIDDKTGTLLSVSAGYCVMVHGVRKQIGEWVGTEFDVVPSDTVPILLAPGGEVMATGKDWTKEAAAEIDALYFDDRSVDGRFGASIQADSAEIIAKHAPFAPGVLYMPVPRCDQCKYWGDRGEGTRAPCLHPAPKRAAGPAAFDHSLIWHDFDDGCVQCERK